MHSRRLSPTCDCATFQWLHLLENVCAVIIYALANLLLLFEVLYNASVHWLYTLSMHSLGQ